MPDINKNIQFYGEVNDYFEHDNIQYATVKTFQQLDIDRLDLPFSNFFTINFLRLFRTFYASVDLNENTQRICIFPAKMIKYKCILIFKSQKSAYITSLKYEHEHD